MKTKYKHINFKPATGASAPKGSWWMSNNKSTEVLGMVLYYRRWRCHVVKFEENAVFDRNCCRDIVHFLEQLNSQKTISKEPRGDRKVER